IRSRDSEALGIKTELKNMNSFRAVFRGLSFEEKRQQQVILAGKTILPETRHWDEARGLTVGMRTKEEADDYRYFPEPNLPPISIDRGWVEELRDSLPEMPDTKIERYTVDYDLPIYDAEVLTSSLAVATFFEECVQLFPDAKAVSNWIMSEVLRLLNVEGKEIQDTPLLPSYVAKTLQLIKDGTISGRIAKEVFEEAFHKGEDPEIIVKTRGLIQISDESELNQLVAQVVKDHPNAVEDYRQGKDKALGFLVGQIMKATRGKANPQLVNKLIKEKL
ncbi:MAG TPA: Asp-tRNA(Asn)/Glu-tRNA(Gln) amidotransferase GatCAB subunit B, partial [bacterium]|nr:Asp-tRNA(Asn)/Glu-tRNA(Gln) amidotransferase GatCAB subunit B [bacterium]